MIISSQRCTPFILLSIAFVRHLPLLCVCVCLYCLVLEFFSYAAMQLIQKKSDNNNKSKSK